MFCVFGVFKQNKGYPCDDSFTVAAALIFLELIHLFHKLAFHIIASCYLSCCVLCVVCVFLVFFSKFFLPSIKGDTLPGFYKNFKTLNFASGFTRLSNLATLFVCVILEVPQRYFTRIEKSPSTFVYNMVIQHGNITIEQMFWCLDKLPGFVNL